MPLVDRDPDRLIGTVLGGRFVIKRCAAVDDAGARYDTWDDELTSDASVRVLHKVRPDDASLRKLVELLTEVSSLGIAGTAPLRAVGRTRAKDVYYATDLVTGEPLSQRLEEGPLDPREAIKALSAAGTILSKCHAKGMVHGGLHPGAIILPVAGGATRVSIVDFGLGPITKASEVMAEGARSASMPFQSPEQASNDPYDHRADVYSLGAVVYAALTGRPPFAGSSVLEILATQLRGEAPSLAKANPELEGSPIQDVLDQAMQVKADDRFATMDAFVRALRVAGKQHAARGKPAPAVSRKAEAKAAAAADKGGARAKGADRPKSAGPYRGELRSGTVHLTERSQTIALYIVGALVMVGAILVGVFWDSLAAATTHALEESAPPGAAATKLPPTKGPPEAPTPAPAAEEPETPALAKIRVGAAPEKPPPLSDRAKRLIADGNKALASGRARTAITRFRAAKREAPDLPIVARSLGLAYAEVGDRASAAAELRRYLELEPSASDARAIRLRISALER